MPDRVALTGRCDPWDLALRMDGEPRCVAFIGEWVPGGALLADRPSVIGTGSEDLDGPGTRAGWWGYDGGGEVCRYDSVAVRDQDGRWWIEGSDVDGATAERWQRRLDADPVAAPPFRVGAPVACTSRSRHIGIVEQTVLAIAAGDFFQANICLRIEAEFTGSALAMWCSAGRTMRAPRAAFAGRPGGAVASLSPEVLLTRSGGTATTRPIKGTRPLTDDGLAELLASGKDAAEHVMIVDLARNDLASVSEPGSVDVPRLLQARPLAGVWHLESAVTACPLVSDGPLLRALFPPGSVTGAPKPAAVNWSARIEEVPRVAYCGSVGFRSPEHGLQANVAIRTVEIAGDRLWLGVGGGIVADSVPAAEWAECRAKAAPVLSAIGAPPWDEDAGPAEVGGPAFETMLVVDGVVLDPDRHAERSGADREKFRAVASAHAADLGPGCFRMRIEDDLSIRSAPIARPEILRGSLAPVELRSYPLPDRFGGRKLRDRRALEAGETACAPAEPLLLDGAEVLETSRANVLALHRGCWRTPALDGRVLPGVMRRSVLDAIVDMHSPVRIGPLSYADLLAAEAVVVTNALRGLWWVRDVDGAARWDGPAPEVLDLAARVRRRMLAQLSVR